MPDEILAALINAGSTVLAAMFGVFGVVSILRHWQKVGELADQVAAYYHYETALVRHLYDVEKGIKPSDQQIQKYRGRLRTQLCSDSQRPTMSAREVQRLADRIL